MSKADLIIYVLINYMFFTLRFMVQYAVMMTYYVRTRSRFGDINVTVRRHVAH